MKFFYHDTSRAINVFESLALNHCVSRSSALNQQHTIFPVIRWLKKLICGSRLPFTISPVTWSMRDHCVLFFFVFLFDSNNNRAATHVCNYVLDFSGSCAEFLSDTMSNIIRPDSCARQVTLKLIFGRKKWSHERSNLRVDFKRGVLLDFRMDVRTSSFGQGCGHLQFMTLFTNKWF